MTRLIPFAFSTTTVYALEMSPGFFRFYKDGARIETSPGVAYEIANDFAESELFQVQTRGINDVLYLVHPNHPPRKLSRISDTNWTSVNVSWKYPALLDENADTTKTFAAAATTGVGVALTSNFNFFTAASPGVYLEIRHLRSATKVELDISVAAGVSHSSSLKVKGDWQLVTTERWNGTLDLERSTDGGTTWEIVRTYVSASSRNVNQAGTQETEALFRLTYTAAGDPYATPPWVGTPPTTYVKALATFEVADAYIAGLVIVATYIDATHATCNIVNDLESTAATSIWSEGAWSTPRGYPRAIGLCEQRLFLAGTTHKPNTLWGSVSGDFENFTYGTLDDAAVAYQFADTEQNPIQWLSSLLRLHAGTSGSEYIVASGNTDEPLSPNNVTVRRQSSYGCEFLPALTIDNGILFIQRQGRRIREMRELSLYANPSDFVAPDLTLMVEHITSAGIVQMDYARIPDPQVYCVMGNGQLAVMTYNREQNIQAWTRYLTDGKYESVACLYGSPSDVTYVIVNRRINGVTKRYVEVFTAETTDKTLGVFMDAAVAVTGSNLTTITGLSHIEGKVVAVVADGNAVGNAITGVDALTVSGGQITLPYAATVVRVGLPYLGNLRPMKIDTTLGNGTSQGRRRRISEVCFRFKDTLGGVWGNTFTGINNPALGRFSAEIPFRSTDNNMDSSPPMFTGDVIVPSEFGNDLDGNLQVFQTQPFPMTILGIFAKMEFFGE